MENNIHIKGARVHNLKNVELKIPRNSLVVITGVSGSGKSSLAFDTLYAEGQRRYVESLSSYARQFLGRKAKPEVDFITGLPPAIAVEQKVKTRNSRSTVGTSTEIYDYLRKLFARIGVTYSPISGRVVKKHQVSDVLDYISSRNEGTSMVLTVPLNMSSGLSNEKYLETLSGQGFTRIYAGKKFLTLDQFFSSEELIPDAELLIERFTVKSGEDFLNRIADSVQTAFYEGAGVCRVITLNEKREEVCRVEFSHNFEADGIKFEEPTEQLFSFNSPLGACPECEGFGSVIGIDEDLVVPNKSLSVFSGAIAPWKGEKMGVDRQLLITHAHKFNFPVHKPYFELSEEEKKLLWTGNEYFEGLDEFFKFLKQNQYKIQYRVMLSRYRGKTTCPVCGGARLKKEATYVKVGGKSIAELVNMPISELKDFFDNLNLNEYEAAASKRLIMEINNRIQCLIDVGLSYLTLNRASNTLSGGESQRINLVSSLGSSLVGSLYVLDEPSIGLHPRDTDALIKVLKRLRDLGNTVVVVEHDKTMMMAADWIIDIGPNAGRLGGEVILEGNPNDLINSDLDSSVSKTLEYLRSTSSVYNGAIRTSSNYIELKGCCENNLKNITVKFPLNTITVVTGVSGSGKSTLVKDSLYMALCRHFEQPVEKVGSFESMSGSLHLLKGVELVDQNPIGKSSRSNPATYIKAYDYIRKLFADQQLSKQMGYTATYFSFNSPGGRCERCEGEGTITVPMQFMADVVLTCEECGGRRFKSEILEVKYKGASIYDVLEMTVNQAVEFFGSDKSSVCKSIVDRLSLLQQVGLGYIKLGQSSSSLSGGESQRVKLAAFLASEGVGHQLFIFDEPTTGLHNADIQVLMNSFQKLIERGHSVIIIEHNVDVIKQADYIIDLGPEGGNNGGHLIFSGTREEILDCEGSYTAKVLRS